MVFLLRYDLVNNADQFQEYGTGNFFLLPFFDIAGHHSCNLQSNRTAHRIIFIIIPKIFKSIQVIAELPQNRNHACHQHIFCLFIHGKIDMKPFFYMFWQRTPISGSFFILQRETFFRFLLLQAQPIRNILQRQQINRKKYCFLLHKIISFKDFA